MKKQMKLSIKNIKVIYLCGREIAGLPLLTIKKGENIKRC